MFEKNEIQLQHLEQDLQQVVVPEGMQYDLPPKSFETLKGEFLGYKKRKELVTKFWIDKTFSNPQGTVQGGIVAACFDGTFGPLGIASTHNAILTIDMNVQYIRPVPIEESIFIVTKVIYISRSTIFLQADAFNSNNKLLAQASSNQLIVKV